MLRQKKLRNHQVTQILESLQSKSHVQSNFDQDEDQQLAQHQQQLALQSAALLANLQRNLAAATVNPDFLRQFQAISSSLASTAEAEDVKDDEVEEDKKEADEDEEVEEERGVSPPVYTETTMRQNSNNENAEGKSTISIWFVFV